MEKQRKNASDTLNETGVSEMVKKIVKEGKYQEAIKIIADVIRQTRLSA